MKYMSNAVLRCAQNEIQKDCIKKAGLGEITNMTGISDPYEEPEHPSLIIDTDKLDLQQCVDKVIEFLIEQGLSSTEFQSEFDTI